MGEKEFNISAATERYNRLRTEIEYQQRRALESATAAVDALTKISQSDIDALSKDFPALAIVRGYTVDQLMRNEHSEQETLLGLWKDMTTLLDQYLTEFEEHI